MLSFYLLTISSFLSCFWLFSYAHTPSTKSFHGRGAFSDARDFFFVFFVLLKCCVSTKNSVGFRISRNYWTIRKHSCFTCDCLLLSNFPAEILWSMTLSEFAPSARTFKGATSTSFAHEFLVKEDDSPHQQKCSEAPRSFTKVHSLFWLFLMFSLSTL